MSKGAEKREKTHELVNSTRGHREKIGYVIHLSYKYLRDGDLEAARAVIRGIPKDDSLRTEAIHTVETLIAMHGNPSRRTSRARFSNFSYIEALDKICEHGAIEELFALINLQFPV